MSVQRRCDQVWLAQLAPGPAVTENLNVLLDQIDGVARPKVVVDLAAVVHLNSSNLSHLLRLRKRVLDQDGRLRLAGTPEAVQALFASTGLDKVFEFSPDAETALADLQT